jgi:hypothetical protein
MKQIQFTIDAFGSDGLLKEGYEVRYRNGTNPDFVKPYYNLFIISVTNDGSVIRHFDSGLNKNGFREKEFDLTMYRRTRTADEVAREWMDKNGFKNSSWEAHHDYQKKMFIGLVQAGMDEMINP